jgi:hypothetical protein
MKGMLFTLVSILALGSARADEADLFFNAQVLPILKNRCYECHSREHRVEGGLALDKRSDWEIGGDHGPAVTPGNLRKSPLVHSIRHLDSNSAMPPKKKLPPIEIAMLETWVMLGAPDPRTEKQPSQRTSPPPDKKQGRGESK